MSLFHVAVLVGMAFGILTLIVGIQAIIGRMDDALADRTPRPPIVEADDDAYVPADPDDT